MELTGKSLSVSFWATTHFTATFGSYSSSFALRSVYVCAVVAERARHASSPCFVFPPVLLCVWYAARTCRAACLGPASGCMCINLKASDCNGLQKQWPDRSYKYFRRSVLAAGWRRQQEDPRSDVSHHCFTRRELIFCPQLQGTFLY